MAGSRRDDVDPVMVMSSALPSGTIGSLGSTLAQGTPEVPVGVPLKGRGPDLPALGSLTPKAQPTRIAALPAVLAGLTVAEAAVVVGILSLASWQLSQAASDAERAGILDNAKQKIMDSGEQCKQLVQRSWDSMVSSMQTVSTLGGNFIEFMGRAKDQLWQMLNGSSSPRTGTPAQMAPQATPRRATTPVAPSAQPDASPQTVTPDRSADLQAQMRQIDRDRQVNTATMRVEQATATLRSADEQIGPLNQSLSAFYWKASTGAPGRTSGEVQAAVRAVQSVKDRLDQVVELSNTSVAGVQTAATTLERLRDTRNAATARQRFDGLSSRRDEIKQLAAGLDTWLQQGYAYAQDGKQALPSLASIPSGRTINIDRRSVTTAHDAAQQALVQGATPMQTGNNAGSAVPPAGTVPPGSAAASGSPQPPGGPGRKEFVRSMAIGAGLGAVAKGAAYIANHRDKSVQDLAFDPGLYVAVVQGAGEGAALGYSWTARGATMLPAELRQAVVNDFVFSGSATAAIDAAIKITERVGDGAKVSDAIHEYLRSGQVFESLGSGTNTGVDAALLGLVPGTFIPIPPLTGISERTTQVLSGGVVSKTTRYLESIPNYWSNMFGQGALRALLGATVDTGNQWAANHGNASKINGERAVLSGAGASLYPFVTQALQRLTIPLARIGIPGLAERSVERASVTSNERIIRTIVNSNLTDTKQPILAYGGRAMIYGALISYLKKEAQEGQGLGQATLDRAMNKLREILGDPKKLEQLVRDPAFKDTLRRMDSLSVIEKETLLEKSYVPSKQASRQLDEMHSRGADLQKWLNEQPQPQIPATEQERAVPGRLLRFHRELDQMINGAYKQWSSQGKP
jgi:hypothetical protein